MKSKKINKSISYYGVGNSVLEKTKKDIGINFRINPSFFTKEKTEKIFNNYKGFKRCLKENVLENLRFKQLLKIERKTTKKKVNKK
jgi:hypothetical protein